MLWLFTRVLSWCLVFLSSTLQGSPKNLICSQSIPHSATSIKEPIPQSTTMGPCYGIAVFLPNLMTIRKRASEGCFIEICYFAGSEDSILNGALIWAGWCSIKSIAWCSFLKHEAPGIQEWLGKVGRCLLLLLLVRGCSSDAIGLAYNWTLLVSVS